MNIYILNTSKSEITITSKTIRGAIPRRTSIRPMSRRGGQVKMPGSEPMAQVIAKAT